MHRAAARVRSFRSRAWPGRSASAGLGWAAGARRRTALSSSIALLCKISAATRDPDLPEMHAEQIEMDDPVVPPGASAMPGLGCHIGWRSRCKGSLLRLEKAFA